MGLFWPLPVGQTGWLWDTPLPWLVTIVSRHQATILKSASPYVATGYLG